MQDTVRCPACNAILVAPAVPPEGDVSCPRCLARVPLSRPAQESIQAGPSPAVTDAPPQTVGPESVRQGQETGGRDSPDLQIKGHVSGPSILIGALIACCILCMFWLSFNPNNLARALGLPYMSGILGVLLVALIAARHMSSKARTTPGLSYEAGCALAAGYVVLAVVAAGVFVFATCALL
jgi:hypothetical protein